MYEASENTNVYKQNLTWQPRRRHPYFPCDWQQKKGYILSHFHTCSAPLNPPNITQQQCMWEIPHTVSFYIKLSLTLSTSQYKFYIMLECTDAQTAQVHSLLVSLCHVWCLLHAYMKAAPSLKPHRVFPWVQTHLKQTIFFCVLHVRKDSCGKYPDPIFWNCPKFLCENSHRNLSKWFATGMNKTRSSEKLGFWRTGVMSSFSLWHYVKTVLLSFCNSGNQLYRQLSR